MFEQIQDVLRILNDNTEYMKEQLIQGKKIDQDVFILPVNKELDKIESDTTTQTSKTT